MRARVDAQLGLWTPFGTAFAPLGGELQPVHARGGAVGVSPLESDGAERARATPSDAAQRAQSSAGVAPHILPSLRAAHVDGRPRVQALLASSSSPGQATRAHDLDALGEDPSLLAGIAATATSRTASRFPKHVLRASDARLRRVGAGHSYEGLIYAHGSHSQPSRSEGEPKEPTHSTADLRAVGEDERDEAETGPRRVRSPAGAAALKPWHSSREPLPTAPAVSERRGARRSLRTPLLSGGAAAAAQFLEREARAASEGAKPSLFSQLSSLDASLPALGPAGGGGGGPRRSAHAHGRRWQSTVVTGQSAQRESILDPTRNAGDSRSIGSASSATREAESARAPPPASPDRCPSAVLSPDRLMSPSRVPASSRLLTVPPLPRGTSIERFRLPPPGSSAPHDSLVASTLDLVLPLPGKALARARRGSLAYLVPAPAAPPSAGASLLHKLKTDIELEQGRASLPTPPPPLPVGEAVARLVRAFERTVDAKGAALEAVLRQRQMHRADIFALPHAKASVARLVGHKLDRRAYRAKGPSVTTARAGGGRAAAQLSSLWHALSDELHASDTHGELRLWRALLAVMIQAAADEHERQRCIFEAATADGAPAASSLVEMAAAVERAAEPDASTQALLLRAQALLGAGMAATAPQLSLQLLAEFGLLDNVVVKQMLLEACALAGISEDQTTLHLNGHVQQRARKAADADAERAARPRTPTLGEAALERVRARQKQELRRQQQLAWEATRRARQLEPGGRQRA
jgi:hypothetical protein